MNDFDDKNPWHAHADFLIGFECERCENKLDALDVESDSFEEQCVVISEQAQAEGWQRLGDFEYICGSCAKKADSSNALNGIKNLVKTIFGRTR